jgi:hypothetical protein
MLGYVIIMFLVTLYLIITSLKQKYFGNISNNEKVFIGVLVFFYTATKVAILNFIEIVVFPLFNSYLIIWSTQCYFFDSEKGEEFDITFIKSNLSISWIIGAAFNALLGFFIRYRLYSFIFTS